MNQEFRAEKSFYKVGISAKTKILFVIAALLALCAAYWCYKVFTKDPLLPYIKNLDAKWETPSDFDAFLAHCSEARLKRIMITLKMINDDRIFKEKLLDRKKTETEIKKRITWISSSWITYPFKSNGIPYHKIVQWAARKQGISEDQVNASSTFMLERALCEKYFIKAWDKLPAEKRIELLKRLEKEGKIGSIKNKAALATATGTSVLAILTATSAVSGFAFYTTLSSVVYTLASAVGVTLPFTAYSSLSALAGTLSGPIGWTLLALGAGGTLLLIGGPDVNATAAMIIQIHSIKVEALFNSGVKIANANPIQGNP